MRIEITRSGGFAGLTRTWTLEVSRTEAEQRWLPLAEAEAAAEAGGSGAESGSQRDRFTYRITIGYMEVHFSENRLDDPWRELIERARPADPGKPDDLL
ncbi:protealysin inhibitor emfourin [Arthrobacter sp. MDT3-44]